MDPDDIATKATGDSVTADRIEDAAVSALADEQPHHLLLGQSIDMSGGEDTERLFPSVDELVSMLVTDRRLLFVVPGATGTRTESIEYDDVNTVSATESPYPELEVETVSRTLILNARDDEPVMTVRQRIEDLRPSPAVEGSARRTGAGTADGRPASGGAGTPVADGPQDGTTAEEPQGRNTDQGDGDDPLDKLERLADLHERGAITDEEFESRKADLLDRI